MPAASMIKRMRQRVKAKPESICVQEHTRMHWARFQERGVVLASQEDALG
jgi:hypothetical protein